MFGRLVAWVHCRRLRRGNLSRRVQPVARLLARSTDERVVRMAAAALDRVWARPLYGPAAVWYGLREAAGDDPSPAVVRFLLAPATGGGHTPPVRVVAALHDGRHGVMAGHHLVRWADKSPELADMLRGTDHPHLLDALEDAFLAALVHPDADPLWAGDGPSPLLRVLLDNPHLARPPRLTSPSLGIHADGLAVLAILKGRLDLLRHYREDFLVTKLVRTAAKPLPAVVTDGCRRVLRELEPGEGRERLCEMAMEGEAEARAAVVDAGFVPRAKSRIPLFLFCTEQWERLDEEDPGGQKLHRHRRSYDERDWLRLDEVAARSGRRPPERPPPPRTWNWPTSRPEPYRPGGTGTAGTGGFGI